MKKKLYANGVLVGEYELTGGNEKDLELCHQILTRYLSELMDRSANMDF